MFCLTQKVAMQVCQSMAAELKGHRHLLMCLASQYMQKPCLSQHATQSFLQVIACVVCRHKLHYPRRRLSWQGLSHLLECVPVEGGTPTDHHSTITCLVSSLLPDLAGRDCLQHWVILLVAAAAAA